MSGQLGRRKVVTPDGVEWQVGRRWLTRRPRWGRARRDVSSGSLDTLGSAVPDMANIDLGEGLLIAAAVAVVVLILIPVLFFGVELIVVGALLAAAVVSRTVLRQPWVIEARSTDPLTSGHQLEWRVRGWRRSEKLIFEVVADLSSGRALPDPEAER
jgi:hypothetical protein